MINITQQELIQLQKESQVRLPDDLERIVSTQEDASLKSPGVIAHYYRFFYFLVQNVKPDIVLEIGTHTGISAACLAQGWPGGKVYSLDHKNYLMKECIRDNITYIHQDSLELVNEAGSNIDILFIDTNHNGKRPLKEYLLYKDRMSQNGLIFFDDVYLFDDMKKFWQEFEPERGIKFDLDVHGKAGFGVIKMA